MKNLKFRKIIGSLMMSVMLFNSFAPYYAKAEGESDTFAEESVSDAEIVDDSIADDMVSEEDENEIIDDNMPVGEADESTEGDEEASSAEMGYEIYTSGNYEYTLSNNAAVITKYVGSEAEIVVPSTLDGYPVKGIGKKAYADCDGITSIELPEGLENIGDEAFSGSQITYILIPSSVSQIDHIVNLYNDGSTDRSPLFGCEKLKKIEFAEGLMVVPDNLSRNLSSVNEVVLPESVSSIEMNAFNNNENLTTINLPDGITTIGAWAFCGCKSLTSIDLPMHTTSIDIFAFAGCSGLEKISFNSDLRNIGYCVFRDCVKVTNIELPSGLETIGRYAFEGTQITYVKIPASVTSMGAAFGGCENLEKIEFEEGMNTVPGGACSGLEALKEVVIPESVTMIDSGAFSDAINLTSISLPNEIKVIGNSAFEGCQSLKEVCFPDSLEEIAEEAFYNCRELSNVQFGQNIKKIGCRAFSEDKKIDKLELPEGIEEIDAYAFSGIGITYVKIPSSVTLLSRRGHYDYRTYNMSPFKDCSQLEKIEFAEGLKEIPEYGFCGITNLKTIVFPDSITKIGDGAFRGGRELYEINIPKNCTSIGNKAFSGCEGLEVAIIPRSVNYIAIDAFEPCEKLTIYGYADSYAQTYANQKGIVFITLDEEEFDNGDGFDLKQHGYCIANSYDGFEHNWFYKLPLERYQEVYGDIYTKHVYDQKISTWEGNCLGMSATAVLFLKGRLNPHDYGVPEGVTLNNGGFDEIGFGILGDAIFKLKNDSELEKLIERYQVWAESVDFHRFYMKSFINYETRNEAEINSYIISKINETKEPFIIVVSWKKDDGKNKCHALVVDSSRKPEDIGEGWTRVYLYDPDNPYTSLTEDVMNLGLNKQALERYVELNTQNGQWRMDVDVDPVLGHATQIGYDKDGKILRNSSIEFRDANDYPVNFETKALFWDPDGNISISYRSNNMVLYDSNDKLIYKKADGNVEYIDNDIVYDVKRIGYVDGNEPSEDEGMLILPQGKYKVTVDSGMIAFEDNGDYVGVVTDNNKITVLNTDSNSLSVTAESSASVNVVAMDSYGTDKYTSVQTNIVVNSDGCDVSLEENKLNINTNDDQWFDVDIISEEGYGEASSLSSNDVKELDLKDYVSDEEQKYSITYDLDGGSVSVNNPVSYTRDTETFELENPTKDGFEFIGWTGSNGDIPETYVVVGKGTKGNLSFKANWNKESSVDPTKPNNSAAMNPAPVIDENTKELHLIKGQKFTLAESGWTSSDKKYVSISKKNVLSVKKVSATPIQLTKGEQIIDVYITKPSMAAKSVSLKAGEEKQIVFNYDSEKLPILWYSNAPDIATVSQNGMVTAHSKGTATITAYVYGSAFTCKVKVSEPTIAIERSLHITLNKSKTVSLKGIKKPVWTADNKDIVTIKGNKFKGIMAGETTLHTEYDGKEYLIHLYVEDPTISTTDIKASGKNKYTVNLKPGDDIPIEYSFVNQEVVYKSSKGENAYYDDGNIVANKPGKAKLTAKVNGKTITINVIVAD